MSRHFTFWSKMLENGGGEFFDYEREMNSFYCPFSYLVPSCVQSSDYLTPFSIKRTSND